jgi:hypothetical protein
MVLTSARSTARIAILGQLDRVGCRRRFDATPDDGVFAESSPIRPTGPIFVP